MQKIINNTTSIGLVAIVLAGSGICANPANTQDWQPLASLSPAISDESIRVKTVAASSQTITLTYAMPTVRICAAQAIIGTDENARTVLLGNAPLIDWPGQPRLPVVPAKIALPPGCTIADVVVVPGEKRLVPGKYIVEHGQESYPLIAGIVPEPTMQDPEIYDFDAAYPGKLFDVVGVQQQCGVSIALVNLYPVEYKPLSGQLAYYSSLTLTVRIKPTLVKTSLRCRPEKLETRQQTVDNPQALSDFYSTEEMPTENNMKQSGIYSPLQNFSYVIITSRAIRDATTDYTVRNLIALRQAQGLTATIVAVEDIYANYTGRDNAEKVRNFIKDAYNNWSTDYVLLGGDINVVPMRKLFCFSGGGNGRWDNIPSDLYYQCLDGTYNNDGDGYWGEPTDGANGGDVDLLAEVYVGRASAENVSEMANFVYKTLAYEKDDPTISSYKHKALMVGEYLGFGGPSEYATDSLEEIRRGSSAHGYTTKGFTNSPFAVYDVATIYDAPKYTWSKNTLISKINSGVYSIFDHRGHTDYNYVMRFYNEDADALRNAKFIFAYSEGCLPGNFEVDCVAEHLTTSTRSGMFAVVCNSRDGYGKLFSTDGASQRYNREFWDAYFGERKLRLGELNTDSHEDNAWRINEQYMRWVYYTSNLLGDPATQLITAPKDVSASQGMYRDKVRVTWKALTPNAGYYEIWRSTKPDFFTASQIGLTSSTTYDDTRVYPLLRYYYWIRAKKTYPGGFSQMAWGWLKPLWGARSDITVTPSIEAANQSSDIVINLDTTSSEAADCWIVAETPMGWFRFDALEENWTAFDLNDPQPSYQGNLYAFPETYELLCLSDVALPAGRYVFYFAVDTPMNGKIDDENIWIDSITVEILPDGSITTEK